MRSTEPIYDDDDDDDDDDDNDGDNEHIIANLKRLSQQHQPRDIKREVTSEINGKVL